MCGIAGFFAAHGAVPEAGLRAMADSLAHRGPDGVHVHVDGPVGLIHTRLAIIDPAGGDQPLFWPGGRILVANGEIYNDPSVRKDMPAAPFRTGSDCESLLALYDRQGLSFPASLRGMIAFALYDSAEDILLLGRDPFGIKPLYVVEHADGVAFASEAQALVAGGFVAPSLCADAAGELLNLQFTTGSRTLFDGIRRLLPGEMIMIRKGRIVDSCRQPLPLRSSQPPLETEREALRALDQALMDSVAVHQRSDVPYGMFLSGGVDSAALLALMSRLNERPVLAFTAGFPETGVHDERDHARSLAQAVGAEHIELSVTDRDFWDCLPRIVACMDDPATDYAIIPVWLLARAARPYVTVVLSGEGGDELFAGYSRYRAASRPWPFTRAMRRRGLFEGLGGNLGRFPSWRTGYQASEEDAARTVHDRLLRAQYIDCADWLPNDLLTKLDRCLMAHGMEGRVPFLDPVVAEVAARLPRSLKIRGGQGKYILRRWLENALPQANPFAPKKGFTVPVGEWIAARGQELGALVAKGELANRVADPAVVRSLFMAPGRRERFAAWSLLFLDLWYRRHIMGQAVDGDVFHVLSSPP